MINEDQFPVKYYFVFCFSKINISNKLDVNNRFSTPPSRRRQNMSIDRSTLNFRNMFES